jgi:hypothetical protein
VDLVLGDQEVVVNRTGVVPSGLSKKSLGLQLSSKFTSQMVRLDMLGGGESATLRWQVGRPARRSKPLF